MTTSNSISADAVLVAIDIAKVRNEVLIEAPGHKRRRRLLVLNTRAEHDHLIEVLQAYGRPVVCAFEATGNYHRPIAWRLVETGFEVRLVSSLALARTREALHNSWDKNDPKDAQVILHMLRIQATQVYHDPLRAGINDVQELSKTHEAIARAKTEIQHRILTHYLPLYFPEIDRFRGNSRSDWFFAFLDAFPTPASITALAKLRNNLFRSVSPSRHFFSPPSARKPYLREDHFSGGRPVLKSRGVWSNGDLDGRLWSPHQKPTLNR